MSSEKWSEMEGYLAERLLSPDPTLAEALRRSQAAGLPSIEVPPLHGKLLSLVAGAMGARRVLEVGTLGGYSTIWLARALPRDGQLVTLELNPEHAEVAQANLDVAGVSDRVEIRVGPAAESLAALILEAGDPFDLIFIDADKPSTAGYFRQALELSRVGTLIVVDNVVRGGAVADEASDDAQVKGIQRFLAAVASEPRVDATALQTVAAKGYDGLAFALVVEP